MMVALLLYAYCVGERSSRRIERRCHEDIAFRVITANAAPDHTTIARFRQVNEQALASCFIEILRLSAAAGLLRIGLVALDGTKVEANASLRANRSLKAIESEVVAMLAEAAATDAEEDQLFGSGRRGDELPASLASPTGRLARLKECRQRLMAEDPQRAYQAELARRAAREKQTGNSLVGRPPKPKVATKNTLAANPTDPHSRIMKEQHRYLQGYNAQAVVTEDLIIVAAGVTDQPADSRQLHPMLKETKASLAAIGVPPAVGVLVADSGYYSEANLTEAGVEDPELFIAMTNDRDQRRGVARGKGFGKGRYGTEMRARLTSECGREIYGKRRQMVEPVFGEIKCSRGADRFMRRGIVRVRGRVEVHLRHPQPAQAVATLPSGA